jgi:hypothetical protein
MEVKNFILFLVIAIGLTILLGFLFPPASAYPYVTQGSSINMSGTYDLEGVYGWTGKLAWWKTYYEEDTEIEPDVIIDLNNLKTYAVYIDPSVWKLGNWYQWDGKGEPGHGNNFVFRVNGSQTGMVNISTKPTVRATITRTPDTPVPEQSAVVIPLPTATTTPKVTAMIITPSPSPTFPKSSIDPFLVALGVIGGSLLFARFRKVI